MRYKCPSCDKEDEYDDRIAVCKHCKRGVKLIAVERKEKVKLNGGSDRRME